MEGPAAYTETLTKFDDNFLKEWFKNNLEWVTSEQ